MTPLFTKASQGHILNLLASTTNSYAGRQGFGKQESQTFILPKLKGSLLPLLYTIPSIFTEPSLRGQSRSTPLTAGQRGPPGSPSSLFLMLKVLQLLPNTLESLKYRNESSCPKAAIKRSPRKPPLLRPRVGSPRKPPRTPRTPPGVSPLRLETPHLVDRAYNSHCTDGGAGSGGDEMTWPRSPRVRDEEEPPRTRLPPASRARARPGSRVTAAQVRPRPNAPV